MNCPKCGGECHTITDITTTGKDFSVSKACCGVILFNWIGLLCGTCGESKKTVATNYWICGKCGTKFKI